MTPCRSYLVKRIASLTEQVPECEDVSTTMIYTHMLNQGDVG